MSFTLTKSQLEQIIPANKKVSEWYESLVSILPKYEINTALRVAAFLSQTGHESGGYTAVIENLNYSADGLNAVFPKYFKNAKPPLESSQYARQPEKIANVVYASRMGNGDTASGDGWKYRGRGLIQLTGKNNYSSMAKSFDKTIEETVSYISTKEGCIESACWFWDTNKLNTLADQGDMIALTKRINGGTKGLDDRMAYYARAKKAFGI